MVLTPFFAEDGTLCAGLAEIFFQNFCQAEGCRNWMLFNFGKLFKKNSLKMNHNL